MSPAITAIVVILLLCGPTVLWVLVRGVRSRETSGFSRFGETAAPETEDGAAGLVARGFWTCSGCHSLNRPSSKHCYHCRLELNAALEPARGSQTPGPLVPVMAPKPERVGVPVMAPMPERVGVPVMAPVPELAGVPATSMHPGRRAAPAAEVPPVCPHLGLKDDRHTRFDFPFQGNACHAGDADTEAAAGRGRMLPRLRSSDSWPRSIGLDEQRALCLTVEHGVCPRYREVPAPSPVPLPAVAPTLDWLGEQPAVAPTPAPPALDAVATAIAVASPTSAPASPGPGSATLTYPPITKARSADAVGWAPKTSETADVDHGERGVIGKAHEAMASGTRNGMDPPDSPSEGALPLPPERRRSPKRSGE